MKPFTNSTTYKHVKYECVQFIVTNAHWACHYAYYVLKRRWADIGKPEVEDVIGKNAGWAYYYSANILRKPWADVGRHDIEAVINANYFYEIAYTMQYEKRNAKS